MTQEKDNARMLLLSDFSISLEKAVQYIADMEKHPEKVAAYNKLLMQNLSMQYETVKEKSLDQQIELVKERVKQWKETIGPVSLEEYVAIGRQWNVPIDCIIDQTLTPEVIKKMLDCFVIGQELYKTKLSVSFFTFLMQRNRPGLFLPKSNLLVCGPSGSGKTYGMQVLSQLFHVPFYIVHCNSLVQEGIVGTSIVDAFTSLLSMGWDKEKIEHSVICFDEFDKLFEKDKTGQNSGAYNARIINELLNVIDDNGEVEFKESYDNNAKKLKISTRKMMFVFTGVFEGLALEKQKTEPETPAKKRTIGFKPDEMSNTVKEKTLSIEDEPSIEDYIRFGVKAEILGRIQNFVYLDQLSVDDLVRLFDLGTRSPFNEFERYFAANRINAEITEDGKRMLAQLAIDKKLGVRGLKSLLQQVLMEDMFDLEVGDDNLLKVTRQYILDNLK